MKTMTEGPIKRILCKFSKKEIANLLLTSVEKLDTLETEKKTCLMIRTVKILKEKFSDQDELILFLRLQAIIFKQEERKWDILRIENAKRLTTFNHLTSEKVSESINKYFKKYNTKCKIFTEQKDCCMKIVLALGGNTSLPPMFCLVLSKLSLVFVNNLKPNFSLLTLKVLRKSFRGSYIEQLTDFKSNITNIELLATKQWSSVCKEIGIQDRQRKNKILNVSQKTSLHKKIDIQDGQKKNNNLNISQTIFSIDSIDHSPRKKLKEIECEEYDKKREPVIEKLKYEICPTGSHRNGKDNLLSYCIVNFEGTDILKGLNKLIELGIANAPLPDYLYKEPRRGKTEYRIS